MAKRKTRKRTLPKNMRDMEIIEKLRGKRSAADTSSSPKRRKMTPSPSLAHIRSKYLGSERFGKDATSTHDDIADDASTALRAKFLGVTDSAQRAAHQVSDADEAFSGEADVDIFRVRRKQKRTAADLADDLGPLTVIQGKKPGKGGIQG
jgi:hypothetical protein